jgi:Predicted integral membrane protein
MFESAGVTDAVPYSAAEIGALAHLYRGEMYRSTVWRTRLDTTSNWAVVTTGIALSVTFSNIAATPLPIVLISFLLAAFLLFEARRYQFFDVWNIRSRVMEAHFYEPMLLGRPVGHDQEWARALAADLKRMRLHTSLVDAIGMRLRRNYGWIFLIQIISYWAKIAVHPTPLDSIAELWERTAVGPLPGVVVMAAGALFYGALLAIGICTYHPSKRVQRLPNLATGGDRLRELAGSEQY